MLLPRQQAKLARRAKDKEHLATSVNAVNLEDRFGDVENRLSLSSAWLAPLNRGSLNSAHFHGTDVPVEEPSTASTTGVLLSYLINLALRCENRRAEIWRL